MNSINFLRTLPLLFLFSCWSFDSYAQTNYNLNNWRHFDSLCSGSTSVSGGNSKTYSCNGVFDADNAYIKMNSGSTLWASGGFKLINSDFTHNNNKVFLEGGSSGDSYFENSDLRADIAVNNKVTTKNSIIRGSVSNVSSHEIVLESDSWVSGNVDAGTKITISDSQVNGRVTNRTNNEIEIKDESVVWGHVNAGSKITVDDSTISGGISNRTLNEIEIKNGSIVQGDVDGGTKITINDSEVVGDVSNRNNNEIIISDDSRISGSVVAVGQLSVSDSEVSGNIDSTNHNINLDDDAIILGDATAANNNWATIYFKDDDSVVHGTCLYRTDPVDACSGTPPINQNPQFEFGTLTDSECTTAQNGKRTCTITFDNTYDSAKPKPLVFVMPTIDANLSKLSLNQTELPSTASVTDTTRLTATIVQEVAPHRNAANNVNFVRNAQMHNIDYFVIEPGVITLGSKAKIVAGTIETKVAASHIQSERNNKVTINYQDYGLPSNFSNTPGVLVQPQTKRNSSKWFTGMAREVRKDKFFLSLEKSEVTSNNYLSQRETVGFVAGEGNGFIQGARFWLGDGQTLKTTELNEKVISPIEQGCLESTDISFAGFDAPPILVANKNSRDGSNGGWLRRCDVTKNKVYFVVEEDMDKDKERGHVKEDVGFFMFDRPNDIGICEGFNNKSPVQTWKGSNGSLEINGSPKIVGALRDGGNRYVGFLDSKTNDRTLAACEGQQCFGLDDLLIDKEALEDVPDNLGNSLDIPYTHNVTSLPITVGGVKIYEYDSISIGTGAVVEIESGKYKIGSLNINGTGELRVKSGDTVTVFTKNLSVNNDGYAGVPIIRWNGDKPVLVGDTHFRVNVLTSGSPFVSLNGNGTFVGLLYSEQNVDMSGNARVYGAVSAKSVNMSSNALIHAETSCIVPVDDYEIDISPATDLALMCGDDSPQFTINTSNNGVAESLGVTVGITPNANEFDVSVLKGSGTYPNYVSNDDGQLTLKVVANNTANIDFDTGYKLTAILVDDSGKEVESQFKFVPFKFSLMDGDNPTNRLDVIAGQATPTVTKVLACDSGDSIVVAENYTGEAGDEVTIAHELDSSWSGSDGSLTYLPEFKEGSATTDLTISESGLFNVTLKDSSFDCTGFAGCPEDGSYDVEGSFAIYSRPWKFAICTNKGSDGNSKDKDSDSFTGAREAFDVYARPIKYTDSSDVCSDDGLLTNNYFESTASVKVTTTLDTPSATDYPDAELGELTPEARLTKQISPNDRSNKGYKFDGLRYSEVGSFNFIATETGSFYSSILGGFKGSKSIGRFYPKYFLQENPEWNVANQNDIAYLSQSYDSSVHQVYPMASGESGVGNALNNYRFFHSDLQAKFGVLDDTAIDNEFLLDTGAGTWSTDRKHWLLNDGAAVLKRVTDSDGVSRKDNPFNTSDANSTVTHFGLTIDGVDPVSFTDSDTLTDSAEFLVQPPARYGRMALDDIGGNSGTTLTIPLRAEFWDGSEFVVNDDDSRSAFDGSKACKQVIWHSDGAITTLASLNGSGSVDDGEEEVTANQNTPAGTDTPREQVRLWLRMGDSKPSKKTGENDISCSTDYEDQPWLQYNWRQLGDEDPSTVVTFGIYRGNDRVIYRGESGLTGQ
ncbi:MSHA biogenesis protein MshQ [Vibrio chagasii]|nr:MSHA biogenesis protein MshQ [Vibrio chagasii]CAH7239416.1 MSHA biogenesis protein MshQ [Vibrio chagasii]